MLFQCERCGCVENTALTYFFEGKKRLCSECHPDIKRWHGRFDKHSAVGLLLGSDGYLYTPEAESSGSLNWRKEHQGFYIVGEIKEVKQETAKGDEQETAGS